MLIRDAATGALLSDAARLARRDPAFAADLDRFLFDRKRIRVGTVFAVLKLIVRDAPVPWAPTELLAELCRRRDVKRAAS